jgi:hypothetical protein
MSALVLKVHIEHLVDQSFILFIFGEEARFERNLLPATLDKLPTMKRGRAGSVQLAEPLAAFVFPRTKQPKVGSSGDAGAKSTKA